MSNYLRSLVLFLVFAMVGLAQSPVIGDVEGGGGGGADDQTAAEVPFTPEGNLAATDVQAMGEELDTEKQPASANLDTFATIAPSADVQEVLGSADYAAFRTFLGLVIGTNVQAFDADLSTWSTVTPTGPIATFLATPTAANFATAVTDYGKLGWTKYTIAETALTTSSTTEDETLFACPQFCKVEYVVVKHSAAFTGGSISAMTVSVGTTGTVDYYSQAHDIFQATGDTVFQDTNVFGSATMAAAGHNVIARFTAVGDDVVNATAGSVDIWVKVSILP